MKLRNKIAILVVFFSLASAHELTAASLADRLNGKILLQVESHGEAWYVSPTSKRRLFLGRPADAFSLLQSEGVGITNSDLTKIPIGLTQSTGSDQDNDGLSDLLEDALGTNRSLSDTDGDGYSDANEITHGYNPLTNGRLSHDELFTKQNSGRIFLQVENHGEAWWINPDDNKRYFLGRPADAFIIMRSFGLGITNADLSLISDATNNPTNQTNSPPKNSITTNTEIKTTFINRNAPKLNLDTNNCTNNDLTCFAHLVETGSSGHVTMNREWTEDGIHSISTEIWNFGPLAKDQFGFSMITNERLMEMDPIMKKGLLELGTPITELEKSEADIAKIASHLKGTNEFCVLTDRTALVNTLNNWASLPRSTSDLDFARCCVFNSNGQSEPSLPCASDFPDIPIN